MLHELAGNRVKQEGSCELWHLSAKFRPTLRFVLLHSITPLLRNIQKQHTWLRLGARDIRVGPNGNVSFYDPYLAWKQMDNYLAYFLHERPDLDPQVKHHLNHFRYQYLVKVSNIFPEDAVLFEQNMSRWSSSCKGDYHRLNHLNPLLSGIENALSSKIGGNDCDVFAVSNRDDLETYPAFLDNHQRQVKEWFRICDFASVEGQGILVVPRSAKKTDLIREWFAEKGFTLTLQQAARLAADLSLYQENLCYGFPRQNCSEVNFSSFKQNPIFLKFKALANTNFSASVLVGLIEAFESIPLDERFKQKGLCLLLQQSYGRILWLLEQALCLDLSQYLNAPKFEAHLDLVHEEILLWLLITEPYSSADLEAAIKKNIAHPSFLRTVSTGMAAFSEILKVLLEPEKVILLFDGCYFENRASLLKSYPLDAFYVVRSPDYEASLQSNLQQLKKENKTVDLLFINFHENILKGKYVNQENQVGDVIAAMIKSRCVSSSLTVVIDQTIGFLHSLEMRDLLDRFQFEIQSRALHIVVLWSHQKFDLLGFDKLSGGSYALYSHNESLIERFKSNEHESLDFLSRQGLAHYFASVPWLLEERRKRIFSNAAYVNSQIASELKFQGSEDQSILVVVKEDAQNFSVDVQCSADFDSIVCQAFAERGIPLMIRSGFGFNLTTIACTRFNMLRFSIGIEDRKFLDEFVAAFNDIFISLKQFNDRLLQREESIS